MAAMIASHPRNGQAAAAGRETLQKGRPRKRPGRRSRDRKHCKKAAQGNGQAAAAGIGNIAKRPPKETARPPQPGPETWGGASWRPPKVTEAKRKPAATAEPHVEDRKAAGDWSKHLGLGPSGESRKSHPEMGQAQRVEQKVPNPIYSDPISSASTRRRQSGPQCRPNHVTTRRCSHPRRRRGGRCGRLKISQ